MQNNDFRTRITSLYGSQTSPMVFCIQNGVFSTRISNLYGSQPSSVVFFAFTTASLWPELIVSMGPRPDLSLCACKTTWLTSELLVSMGPSLHLWFLHAKLRLNDQNYKSLLVPHLIYVFCIQNRDFIPRIVSHYGSQHSSVVLCTHNSGIMTRINSLYGSQTSPVVVCMQNNEINMRITSLYGSQPSSVFFEW